ncbi:MAG: type III pantothenate kinase [Dongiaceae bacterium]
MLLAINSGNTNVSFAIYDGDSQLGRWRISTDPRRTADEYGVWLRQLMDLQSLSPASVDGAIIASVVPGALFNLKSLVRKFFKCEPLVIGDGNRLGIKANIDRPEEAGADRLVNAFAAHRKYRGPAVVIDFGTATTFDVVERDGGYAGGAIAPGINLSLQALHMGAAKLPSVAIERPPHVIGRNTVACMQSGIFWGYVGLIEGLVARIRQEHGAPMTVIATGGLAPLFHGATAVIEHVDEDLTLTGLAWLYAANQPRST